MSTRHIHARPGEYIAVHRGSSSGDGAIGILVLVAAAVLPIYLNWEAILDFLFRLFMAVLIIMLAAGILWLLWKYRAPIWRVICWTARMLWRGIRWAARMLWRGIRSLSRRNQTAEADKAEPVPQCMPENFKRL